MRNIIKMIIKNIRKLPIDIQTLSKLPDNSVYAAYLGFAIGDALGVPVEFLSRDELKKNPVIGMKGGGFHHNELGVWSDDTSLMIANSHALALYGYKPEILAKEMIAWMDTGKFSATGQMFGIGNGTRKSLERIKAGSKAIEAGGCGPYSNGNGSLMRILPLIFFLYSNPDFEKRKRMIYEISAITHRHKISQIACHFYVELCIKTLQTGNFKEAYECTTGIFVDYYKDELDFERLFSKRIFDLPEEEIKSGGYVINTLEAAIWCIGTTHNFKDAVLKAVNLGYDADTVGAITGGLAGMIYGKESIPVEWELELVNRELLQVEARKMEDKLKTRIKYY